MSEAKKTKKTFWDRFAFAYDASERLNKKAYHSMVSQIVSLVPPQAKILECAAGTGEITIAVAPKAESVLCTDLSIPMLDKAQKKAKKKNLKNIIFAERDLFHLPESNESFDVVIAANVIHLLDNPNDAIMELWRVTKKKGFLIIPTFLTAGSKAGFSMLIKLYGWLGFHPKYNFTETEYKALLENCGLPKPNVQKLEGRIPVGFAVFNKS